MRVREPKTTALIFRSGKLVVTGAKSEEDARLAARKYARIIQRLDFPAKFTDFKIQNMVGSCDVKFPIRCRALTPARTPIASGPAARRAPDRHRRPARPRCPAGWRAWPTSTRTTRATR